MPPGREDQDGLLEGKEGLMLLFGDVSCFSDHRRSLLEEVLSQALGWAGRAHSVGDT